MKKKNKNAKNIRLVALGLGLVVVAFAALELTGVTNIIRQKPATAPASQTPVDDINYGPPTEQDKTQVETNKTSDDNIKDAENQANPTVPVDKNVVISSVTQNNSKEVVVQTQLFGIGWQKCTLTLTLGSQKVVKTADTLYQPSFSTCLGFSVPYAELGATGTWQVDLSVTNSDSQTHNATPLTVKVQP